MKTLRQLKKELVAGRLGKNPRNVIRGLDSRVRNEVGIHWLRISVPRQYLSRLLCVIELAFGKSCRDNFGLWSYDSRYRWENGASLNFDAEIDRSEFVHRGKVTLDIPGGALDRIADLQFFMHELLQFRPVCTRIDVFFDDYQRTITPNELNKIAEKKDFSGFVMVHHKTSRVAIAKENATKLVYDELSFGRRGQNGCGKYLRVYDKNLESEGKKNCIRYEVEFTKERANLVFYKLCETGSIDAFATLCGALVAGSVKFVHRNGDKNIGRLKVYNFWQKILDFLGKVVIRVPSKEKDIAGKYRFIRRQVTPTLALLREVFIDDIDFFNWLNDAIGEGELRMSQAQINLARVNKRNIRYDDGKVFDNDGVLVS